MKLRAIALLAALLWASSAWATTVTGTMKDIQGSLLSGTGDYATFQLMNFGSNVPKLTGTGILLSKVPFRVTPAQLQAGVTIQGNYLITPAGTFYRVAFFQSGEPFRSADYRLCVVTSNACSADVASLNLDSATPLTTTPVVAPPTGDSTYLRLDAGNSSNLAGRLLGPVCRADLMSGADGGAKIAACIAVLSITGGTVNAVGMEGAQTIPSDVFTAATKNVRILWGAGTYSFGANTTFPANIEHMFGVGSIFAVPNGITVTINGPLSAPVAQIFSLAGTGQVVFGHGAVKEVYPQWWGARADGVTDDSAAVQAAINSNYFAGASNSGGRVYFPAGIYLLNSQIDVTDFQLGISLVGPRSTSLTGVLEKQRGANLRGNHVGIMFDFTGSRLVTLENLFIDNGASIPSVGLLFARSTTNTFADFNTLRQVYLFLASRPAANGGNGTVALYNRAAEIFSVEHSMFGADNPAVITSSATFGVASAFKTIGGSSSTSFMTFDENCSFAVATNGIGNALFLSMVRNLHFNNSSFYRNTGGTNNFALRIYQSDNVLVSGQIEVFPRLLDLSGLNHNIKLETSIVSDVGSTIYFSTAGAALYRGLVNVLPISGSVVQNLFSMLGETAAVTGCTVHLYNNQAFGTISEAGQNYLIGDVTAGVTLDSKTTYVKRLSAKAATALAAGDFALSGGWGSTASVGTVRGTDQFFSFVITSAGTGQGASPTITLTYHDGTWTTAPPVTCNRQDFASQPTVTFSTNDTSATALVLTFNGTPVAAESFKLACHVGGI